MTVDEIKEAVSMLDILERYGIENRRGMVSCPLHKDKTPSMKIYKNGFRCFSCGWNGDVFDFVMRMDDLSFKEAFMALGGTYDTKDREEVKQKIRQAEKRRQARAEKEARLKRRIDENNRYISALRNGTEYFPVYSEEWCFCQNALPYQLYLHDILNEMRADI